MRKLLFVLFVALLVPVAALAGSPHFVGNPQIVVSGNTVTASGKIAGLGNETQVNVVLSGDAACVNRGSNKPQAANKESFSVAGSFPVQNGKALFSLSLEAVFSPSCSPPMSVEWSNIMVVDAEHGLVFP